MSSRFSTGIPNVRAQAEVRRLNEGVTAAGAELDVDRILNDYRAMQAQQFQRQHIEDLRKRSAEMGQFMQERADRSYKLAQRFIRLLAVLMVIYFAVLAYGLYW